MGNVYDEIRSRCIAEFVPRDRLAAEYGFEISYIYRILRNETSPDPNYLPAQLAPKPLSYRHSSAVLDYAQVQSLRSKATARYAPTRVWAREFGVGEEVIRSVLKNRTWFDPEYKPEGLAKRDELVPRNDRTGVVYGLLCACGSCPGRVEYVGQTTQDLEKRWRAHRAPRGKDAYTPRGRWISEHSKDHLEIVELERDPEEGLDRAEVKWISRLNTMTPNGKNATPGGYSGAGRPGELNGSAKLSEAQVLEIIEKLNTPGVTSRSLASEYGVTKTLILKIDQGHLWNDLPRPYGKGLLGTRRRSGK